MLGIRRCTTCYTRVFCRHYLPSSSAARASYTSILVAGSLLLLTSITLYITLYGLSLKPLESLHSSVSDDHVVIDKRSRNKDSDEMIVCTLVRNEGFYLREWMDFHLNLGVTLIVVYDHGSTDNTEQLMSEYVNRGQALHLAFPPDHCDLRASNYDACRMCSEVTREMLAWPWVGSVSSHYHIQTSCQTAAMQDCVSRFGGSNQSLDATSDKVRWLATFDVDEFMFPCAPDQHSLLLTLTNLLKQESVRTNIVQCLRFGTSGFQQRINSNESLLQTHFHRAPYSHLSMEEKHLVDEMRSVCDRTVLNRTVCDTGGWKYISVSSDLEPNQVSFMGHRRKIDKSGTAGQLAVWKDRKDGEICCNHYHHRSTDEVVEKAKNNHNPLLLAQAVHSLPFYNLVEDTLILAQVDAIN